MRCRPRSASLGRLPRSTLNQRQPSRPWSCWARCWSCERARPRAVPSALCCAWRRRMRAWSPRTAPNVMSRSSGYRSGSDCGCGPASACRSMACSPKAPVRWTSPWSPANPCLWTRRLATGSRAARRTVQAALSCAPSEWVPAPCWLRSCGGWARPSAAARPSNGWPTACRAGSCPPSSQRRWSPSSYGRWSGPSRDWPMRW